MNDLINAVKCPDKIVNAKNQAKKARKQWRKKVRKHWKPTGRKFSNIGYQWIPTGRKFNLNELCPKLSKLMPIRKWIPTGRTIPLRSEHTLNRSNTDTSTASISDDSIFSTSDVGVPITVTNQVEPIIAWGSQLSVIHSCMCSTADRSNRSVVPGLRLFQAYDWRPVAAHELHE